MIQGLIGRRASHRVPFEAEVNIKFEVAGKPPVLAVAGNISSGGLQFTLPKGKIKFAPEDQLELIFHLPSLGDTLIRGEICYFANTADAFGNPQICYGLKFLDITPELWRSINEYCSESLNQNNNGVEPETKNAVTESTPSQSEEDLSHVYSLSQDRIDDILQKIVPIAPKQEKKLLASTQKPAISKTTQPAQFNHELDSTAGELNTLSIAETNPTFPLEDNTLSKAVNQLGPIPVNPEESFFNGQDTPAKPAINQTNKISINKVKPTLPELQQNLIDLIYGSSISVQVEKSSNNLNNSLPSQEIEISNTDLGTAKSLPDTIALKPEIVMETTTIPLTPFEAPKDDLINQVSPRETAEKAAALSLNSLANQSYQLEESSNIGAQQVNPPPLVPTELAPHPAVPPVIKESPGFNPAMFKSSSLASMDQEMIDHIVRNLSHASNQRNPSSAATGYGQNTVSAGHNQNQTIVTTIQIPGGKVFSGFVEQLHFTGVTILLSESIAINSQITLGLTCQGLSLNNLAGTCTACKQANHAGSYQIEIFFNSLSQDQQIKIQSLITKAR